MIDHQYFKEGLSTIILIIAFFVIRYIIIKITKRYSEVSHLSDHRTNLILKYINIFFSSIFFIAVSTIWGVRAENLFTVLSSILAIIGVALFAQWSILSNVTSGVIIFFSFPFRIGDIIKIHDKDFPIEAQIEDIKSFHTLLRTLDGELITYPNNLLLQKGITIVPLKKQEEREFYD